MNTQTPCNCNISRTPCNFAFVYDKCSAALYDYDKCGAAFYEAAVKHYEAVKSEDDGVRFQALQFIEAAKRGNGLSQWYNALRDYGFNVLQAVQGMKQLITETLENRRK